MAIDCLGYGGSSKPTDPKLYTLRGMADDVIEILDNKGVVEVIPIGHDWGSPIAQRIYNYHPERVQGLATVGYPYHPGSGLPFDLDETLQHSFDLYGYGFCWYFKLFAADDGAEILNSTSKACGVFVMQEAPPSGSRRSAKKTAFETSCSAINVCLFNHMQTEGRKTPSSRA